MSVGRQIGAASLPASARARLLRLHLVHTGAVRRQHHAECLERQRRRDLVVEHVGPDGRGVTIERVAVAGAARDVLPELVTGVKNDHLLGGQRLARAVRPHDVRMRADTRRAALEAPGRRPEALAAVGDHHVGRRCFKHLLQAQAAAKTSGSAGVAPEPRPRNAQREVHFDRLDRDVMQFETSVSMTSIPSLSGRAPIPPAASSLATNGRPDSGSWPPNAITSRVPELAAGILPGRAPTSAPRIVSAMRLMVAVRQLTGAGGLGFTIVPSGSTASTARKQPPLFGMEASEMARTA